MTDTLKPIRWKNGILYLLEQRLLPFKEVWVKCESVEKTAKAIEEMTVRGAPAIGITAAYGVAVGAGRIKTNSPEVFVNQVERDITRLRKTRPTAVNLFWALDRMRDLLLENGGKTVAKQKKALEQESLAIHREDEILCDCLGRYGAEALKSKLSLRTALASSCVRSLCNWSLPASGRTRARVFLRSPASLTTPSETSPPSGRLGELHPQIGTVNSQ